MRNFLNPTLAAFAAASLTVVSAGLADQTFTYTNLPYQADPNDGDRGRQFGYNICNSTTEGQDSLCQTGIINSLDDFCLWGGSEPNSVLGNMEGEAIAWCSKAGRGTRVIPAGAITGIQFMRTPDYIQITGHINQALINYDPSDDGGELDPHGADERGNPLGGLLFSTAWSNDNNTYVQAREWHSFMGDNVFCLKACDPAGPNAAHFCEHRFDRIGCDYNAPAAYEDGVFESCLGDNQDFPGTYTDSAGHVQTYTQPPEGQAIASMPYVARIPASSQCVQFNSQDLFNGAPQPTTTVNTASTAKPSSSGAATSSKATTAPSGTAKTTAKTTGGSASSSPSSTASGSPAPRSVQLAIGGPVTILLGLVGVVAGGFIL